MLGFIVKIVSLPPVQKLVGAGLEKLFGQGKTENKVAAAAGTGISIALIVSTIMAVIRFVDPGLAAVLEGAGVDLVSLVSGLVGVITGVVGYYQKNDPVA